MPLLHRHILIALGLAMGITAAHAGDVGPGSPAPAIDVKTWYKGTPVKEFDKDKLYVVEFWATWCGPCKISIPHLTELAEKNKDVTFVGVSIWEDDNGTNVKKFVDDMGDKMDYNVAYSGNQTGMAETWMKAAGQNGIPTAFIVKNGQIEWIGHPMAMEEPLSQIKAGTFDEAAFKTKFEAQAAENRQQMEAGKAMSDTLALISANKLAEAKTKIADIEAKYPKLSAATENLKFALLAKENPKQWESKAKAMADSKDPQKIQGLVEYAMNQSREGGDVKSGSKAMDLALGASKPDDVGMFYTGAMYYDQVKDYKKATALIDKAIAALPNSQFKDNADAKTALTKMKEQITAHAKPGSK